MDPRPSSPRVLHCIQTMGGGGAERQLSLITESLTRRGWIVDVALMHGGSNLARLQRGGGRVHWLAVSSNYDPRVIGKIRRIIRQIRPALVQTWLPHMDVLGGYAAHSEHLPWILSERSSGDAFRGTWKQRLRVMSGRRASGVIANSAGGAAFWSEKVPTNVTVRVIPNILDIVEIDAARVATAQEIGIPRDAHLVLAAGRCVPEKNHIVLIEAMAELPPNVYLAICGEGPLLQALQQRTRERSLGERVLFPGFVRDLTAWMKRAEVFVSVSLYEGHPNAVLEAMAARCPVVVSDVAAHRAVVSNETAVFADVASSTSVAAAIRGVLSSREERVLRVEKARKSAEAFTADSAGEAYDRFYREVAGL